jgi:hypothetical protein
MEKANSTANIEHVLAKGSYLYRSSTISGDFNNAQKPFQIKTGDSINKLTALRNEVTTT